jgi:uncharacterized protein with FMN-binding domain
MKRAPFVLAGTVAGLAGLLAFHTRPPAATARPASGPPATGSGTATSHPAAGGSQASGSTGKSAAQRAAAGGRSAAGAVEQYGYGVLRVEVTAAGHRITGVSLPLLRASEPYSQQLDAQAIPQLRAEVLAGQTAHIHGVSGATYTSQAYALSVQAALDKLHLH